MDRRQTITYFGQFKIPHPNNLPYPFLHNPNCSFKIYFFFLKKKRKKKEEEKEQRNIRHDLCQISTLEWVPNQNHHNKITQGTSTSIKHLFITGYGRCIISGCLPSISLPSQDDIRDLARTQPREDLAGECKNNLNFNQRKE